MNSNRDVPMGPPANFDQFEAYFLSSDADIFHLSRSGLPTQNNQQRASDLTSEDEQGKIKRLMEDLRSLKESQQSCGMPILGDLFRANTSDIEETLNSVFYMVKQRVSDVNFRQEVRLKFLKHDQQQRLAHEKLDKEKQRNESLQKKLNEMEQVHKNQSKLAKEERDRVAAERDELAKKLAKIEGKEA